MINKKWKGYLNALIYRISNFNHIIRFKIQSWLRLTNSYQPNPFQSQNNSNTRLSSERLKLIKDSLPKENCSFLDIGCNQGYFLFELAENSNFCLGIDSGRNEIMYANSLKSIHKIKNVIFENREISKDDLIAFPRFDVIIFLSVFHHLVKNNNRVYAEEFMENLSFINSKYLFFETGQPDEISASWSKDLDFMNPNSDEYISGMLRKIGYKKIKKIGSTKSFSSAAERSLFFASKI